MPWWGWVLLCAGCLLVGSAGTFLGMHRRERRAERAQELTLAAQARLDVPEPSRPPSWVVTGWHEDGENLTLASTSVGDAKFQQKTWLERTDMPGFRRPLQLVRRDCQLTVQFTAFTLLHNQGRFADAVRELQAVWPPEEK